MCFYFVTGRSKHYYLNISDHLATIMLSAVAYISYLTCCSHQIPNKKKLKKGVGLFCLAVPRDTADHGMENIAARAEGSWSYCVHVGYSLLST